MDKTLSKTGSRKTTIILAVVLCILVVIFLFCYFIFPPLNHYYVTHHIFDIHNGMTEELKGSDLFEDMQSGKSFCFLGDSITCGTVTEGIPWYQPLTPYITGDISNLSHSGWMVQSLIDHQEEIPSAQIYVIAIGINDVLFPENSLAAETPEEYINRLSRLAELITDSNPEAKIYFITPWTFTDMGEVSEARGDQFRSALAEWCRSNDHRCIDPDPVILPVLNEGRFNKIKYMQGNFHPNVYKGIGLFSYAVLKAALAK